MTDLEKMHTKVRIIKDRYTEAIKPLSSMCKQFKGLTAKIPYGEYKGRWGKITYVSLDDDGNVIAVIQPYKIKGQFKHRDLLWDRLDARTYWKLADVKAIRIENGGKIE